ncbi:MAG: hypothetical protein J5825_03285 [Lachnospiraceae bacterium]|nr:hypothetical protein [Lachnospiraceae bacterium]
MRVFMRRRRLGNPITILIAVGVLLLALIAGILLFLHFSKPKETDPSGGKVSDVSSGTYLFMIDDQGFPLAEARIIFMNYECLNEKVYCSILGEGFWSSIVAREQDHNVSFAEYIKDYCVLPELVCVKALTMMAADLEITVPEEDKTYLEAATNQFYNNLSTAEKETLGVSYETCYKTFEDYYLAHLVMEYYSKDVNREISDEAARVAVVREIRIHDKDRALEAYKLIKEEGKNFDTVLNDYDESKDEILNRYVKRQDHTDQYNEIVFALQENDLSTVFQDGEDYLIVKCIDSFDDKATAENKSAMVDEMIYNAWYDDYQEYMKDKKTRLNKTAYDSVVFTYQEEIDASDFFEIYDKYVAQLYK